MSNDYYQDINNLFGLDVDTFNRYCPGVYASVVKNCQGKNTDCCISTCGKVCNAPGSGCSSEWKDICDDNCDDIMNQITPPPKPDDNKVLSVYCNCKKQICNNGDCDFDQSGQVMDCCDSQQTDCHIYVDNHTKCDGDKPPVPPTPQPTPQPKPVQPKLLSETKNSSGFFSNLTPVEIGGIVVIIILIIVFILVLISNLK